MRRPRTAFPVALGATLLLATSFTATAVRADSSVELQITGATSPAPEDQRASASVLGYTASGELEMLREGEGELICLADDPSDDRFHVACYHRSMEPFMARGRQLRAEGKKREEVQKTRGEEIDAGLLEWSKEPKALYSMTGDAGVFDPETGEVNGARRVYVLYVPWATLESTGLPAEPIVTGAPWLMSEGTPWAHVMVVMPPPETEETEEDGEG